MMSWGDYLRAENGIRAKPGDEIVMIVGGKELRRSYEGHDAANGILWTYPTCKGDCTEYKLDDVRVISVIDFELGVPINGIGVFWGEEDAA